MVVRSTAAARVDGIFHALGDATRRDIVARVMRRAHNVSTLAGCYDMSFAAVQKHVAVLERAGLIRKERSGREQRLHANPAAIRRAQRTLDRLEAVWLALADRLDQLLSQPRQGDD
jgi:DNA-binding transcriptional ArsR family regulator